jgi:hypothetical protein
MEKKYDLEQFIPITRSKTWQERFDALKKFRETFPNKWPKSSSTDPAHKSLFMLTYQAKKAYKAGKLDKQKENLLRSVGVKF